MDYTLEKSAQQGSLMQALGQWNSLMDFFKDQFTEEDMKSRDFKKIQLAEFSRIIDTNNNRPLTMDERSYMLMLKFKKKTLVQSLYPKLLPRLIYLTRVIFSDAINTKRELEMVKQAKDERIVSRKIKLPEQGSISQQAQNAHPSGTSVNEQHGRYGADLGGRKPSEQKPGGPSM